MNNRQSKALHEMITNEERTRDKFRRRLLQEQGGKPAEKTAKIVAEPTYAHYPLFNTTKTARGLEITRRPTTPITMADEVPQQRNVIPLTREWTGRDLKGQEIFCDYPVNGGGIAGKIRSYQDTPDC